MIDRSAYTPPDVSAGSKKAFLAGIVGLVIFAVLAAVDSRQFFKSYLLTYVFWLNMASGALSLMIIHHLSGGMWGIVVRRIWEAATRTFPLMAVLFIPIIIGIPTLYEWSHADVVAADKVLRHKSAYLNTTWFIIRAVIYFALWIGIAAVLNRWSLAQETAADPIAVAKRMRTFAGPAMLVQGLIVTFASVDWLMSLEPHWYSSIYPVIIGVGQLLGALAMTIITETTLSRRGALSGIIKPVHLHDHGKLMLAFVMLWAYLSFSQFLIQWSGNIAEETPWYLRRSHDGWQFLAIFLIAFHFALPFLLLLSRDLKRNPGLLAAVAVWILFVRFVDLTWNISPAWHNHPTVMSLLMSIAGMLAIGGLWLGFFLWQLGRRAVLPLGEPRLEEALAVHA